MAASIRGVAVWLRTKKRPLGTSSPWSRIASQRISAFVPCGTNHSGGSGLTIDGADWAQAGRRPAAPERQRGRSRGGHPQQITA